MRYVKRGSVARWENGCVVLVRERGLAIEEDGAFSCSPEPGELLPAVDPGPVGEVAAAIHEAVRAPVRVERLVVTEGIAEHHVDATVWTERHERVHVSLVTAEERVLIDLGSFGIAPVVDAVNALATAREPFPLPRRVRLSRAVAAATIPLLVGRPLYGAALRQSGGGLDGRGLPIAATEIVSGPWPNWFRPSYRARPVRMPLNLRLDCPVTDVDPSLPRAVAVVVPAAGNVIRVLVVDGERSWIFPLRVRSVEAVGPAATWFPYAGGAFGAETAVVLEG